MKRKEPCDGNTEANRIALKDQLFNLLSIIPHNTGLLVKAEIPLVDGAKALNENIQVTDNLTQEQKTAFQNHTEKLSSFMDLLHEKLNEIFDITDEAYTLIDLIEPTQDVEPAGQSSASASAPPLE